MKELSIEQKAQRYDEAIKIAKDSFTYPDYPGFIRADVVFPELKESEDEKTRKDIISFVEQAIDAGYGIISKERKEEWIAWLEKQGKLMKALQISNARIGELIEKNYNMGISEATRKKLEDNLNKALEKETPESCNEFLKKQDEQDNNEDEAILHRFSFYSYKDEPNILYLAGLYVNDEYRNKGIGTKILKIADEVAVSMKCSSILLKTEIGSNAERLYKNNGYNIFRREENQVWLEKRGEKGTNVNEREIPFSEHKPLFKEGDTIKCKYDDRQFTIKSVDLDKGTYSYTQEGCGNDIDYADEMFELVEQKPADKVEPKFKVGDWIVIDGEVLHIKEVTKNGYLTDEDGFIPFRCEKEAKLWAVQYAKEGDVLRIENLTFIFQEITNDNVCHKDAVVAYCSYEDNDNAFGVSGPDCITDLELVTPATKEQRDLLFQKMKESGYKWNAEKKELEKIENKNPLLSDFFKVEYERGKADTLKCVEWSEEDKKMARFVGNAITTDDASTYLKDKGIEVIDAHVWLDSLKDRVKAKARVERRG